MRAMEVRVPEMHYSAVFCRKGGFTMVFLNVKLVHLSEATAAAVGCELKEAITGVL